MSLRARSALALSAPLTLSALLVLTACGGQDGVTGRVLAVDDTGRDDSALPGGWVATFTADQLNEYLAGAGIDQSAQAGLPYLRGSVRHEDVATVGGSLRPVDDGGEFVLGAVTGERHLCLLQQMPQVDLIRGCDELDVPADGELEITVGEGGMHVTLER